MHCRIRHLAVKLSELCESNFESVKTVENFDIKSNRAHISYWLRDIPRRQCMSVRSGFDAHLGRSFYFIFLCVFFAIFIQYVIGSSTNIGIAAAELTS